MENEPTETNAATLAEQEGRILGVNTRHYPTQGEACELRHGKAIIEGSHLIHDGHSWCNDPPPVRAVLVAGRIGDYACYVGIGDAEWIKAHGDKIRFEEAKCHFPGIEKSRYRS